MHLYSHVSNILQESAFSAAIQAIYIPGRSYGDYEAILQQAAVLHAVGDHCPILLTNSDGRRVGGTVPGEACPGFVAWSQLLAHMGVKRELIMATLGEALQSKQENDELVRMAKARKWESVLFVANAHQLARFMLGAIASMDQLGYTFRLYTSYPRVNWDEIVRGSQAEKPMPRWIHVAEEAVRTETYQKKGDLVDAKRFDEYMAWRDKI
ncbi:MAG: hypothetical protein KW802_01950 [Candidatus Doudnabacteria bacterium]|nr:hypothetical protein [Candidatus Doudnabacteria bacterium]